MAYRLSYHSNQWRRHGVDWGGCVHPSFPRGQFSNSRNSVVENFGGILSHATTTTTKKMNYYYVADIITPFELVKGVVVKISPEGCGPEPFYILIHHSLFCLATLLIKIIQIIRGYKMH